MDIFWTIFSMWMKPVCFIGEFLQNRSVKRYDPGIKILKKEFQSHRVEIFQARKTVPFNHSVKPHSSVPAKKRSLLVEVV